MHPLGPKRVQIIVICVVIAFISIAFVSIYSLHLLNKTSWEVIDDSPAIDIYDQKLQYDMGISADNYENRELYTDEIYENDKIQILKNIKNQRYDFVASQAKDILAKYKFNDNKLMTITTLEKCEIFDTESEATNDEKITFMSGIVDPDIYLWFFLKLDVESQRMLVTYDNVQMLPGFNYENITYTKEHMNYKDNLSQIIGVRDYYKVELTYKNQKFYVYLIESGSLQIFYINNENHNMNGFTY